MATNQLTLMDVTPTATQQANLYVTGQNIAEHNRQLAERQAYQNELVQLFNRQQGAPQPQQSSYSPLASVNALS